MAPDPAFHHRRTHLKGLLPTAPGSPVVQLKAGVISELPCLVHRQQARLGGMMVLAKAVATAGVLRAACLRLHLWPGRGSTAEAAV